MIRGGEQLEVTGDIQKRRLNAECEEENSLPASQTVERSNELCYNKLEEATK